MNEDCLLSIFKDLPLLDLLAVAETSKHLYYITVNSFKQRFAKKLFKIHGPYSRSAKDNTIIDSDDFVKLTNLNTIYKVVLYYGDVLLNLDVEYQPDSHVQDLVKIINLVGSDSLIQYHVTGGFFSFFQRFEKPFTRLQNLKLSGSFDYLGNSTNTFSQWFPSVRRMSLRDMNVYINDPNGIVGFYPNLEHVEFEICDNADRACFNETVVGNFIKANTHILSLELRFVTRKFLKLVAETLKNLSRLRISGYRSDDDDVGEIHFDNLQSFGNSFSTVSMPSNIHFKILAKFYTDALPKKCSSWMDFVENSTTLKKFSVIGRTLLSSEIERLAQAHLPVNEAILILGVGVDDQTLIKFIENCHQLTKVHFVKFLSSSTRISIVQEAIDETMCSLKEKFEGNWVISNSQYQIFMDKKN